MIARMNAIFLGASLLWRHCGLVTSTNNMDGWAGARGKYDTGFELGLLNIRAFKQGIWESMTFTRVVGGSLSGIWLVRVSERDLV